ncbi:MAG: DUF2202 domain-containing protein [Epsilonproteobacteria bacterium]|nr:DUF2202 domain-containing protein [Campylobacterota bacterium]
MKKIITIALTAGLISTLAMARGGHGYGHANHSNNQGNQTYLNQVVDSTPIAELTQEQKDDLVFMYQEEKMARDVYKTLGDIWGAKVFYNIQNSEQKHMDSVKSLLEKYSIPVPVLSDEVGVFENDEIQALYDSLVEQGKESLEAAYNVGVAIEETDIADLQEKIIGTPDDIKSVYSNLLSGSYNHLNAFTRLLDRLSSSQTSTSNNSQRHGRHGRR